MDIIINELDSTVEIASEEILLDPAVLRRVVSAVLSRLRDEETARRWDERERRPLPMPRP
jgi:hypothetical protein